MYRNYRFILVTEWCLSEAEDRSQLTKMQSHS